MPKALGRLLLYVYSHYRMLLTLLRANQRENGTSVLFQGTKGPFKRGKTRAYPFSTFTLGETCN